MVDTTHSQPIPTEEERFREAYPALTSLLICWNVAAYDRQDDEILIELLKEDEEILREAVEEGREFLHKRDFSWEVLKETANYSQPYDSWMAEWLTGLLEGIEAALTAREQAKQEPPETSTKRMALS